MEKSKMERKENSNNGDSKSKKDPKAMREKAKKLIEQAAKIEEKQYIQLGKMVKQHHTAEWRNFDLEVFKKHVANTL